MSQQKKRAKQKHSVSPELYQLLVQGSQLFDAGEPAKAEQLFKRVIAVDPKNPDANHMLGIIANHADNNDAALKFLNKALKASPKTSQIHCNLGAVYKKTGQLSKAAQCFNKAIYLSAKNGSAYNQLGGVFEDQGQLIEAGQAYRKAVELNFFAAYSNQLLLTNYRTDLSHEAILNFHKGWEDLYRTHHPSTLPPFTFTHQNTHKRIKIGYVSPDFNAHSVSYFFEPLLANHDKSKFDVYCYYASQRIDETTLRLKELAGNWRSIVKLTDQQTASLIQQDGIDILIDMSGHTGRHRLGIFTYQAAPIQISWLGYPNTSGLSTIQYRISDEVSDPSNINNDSRYTEKLIRLKGGFLCYQGQSTLPVNPEPPSARNNFITFGSFNNLRKVNHEVIEAWAKILNAAPDSRLLIKSKQFAFTEVKQRILKAFSQHGIHHNRLILKDRIANQTEHLMLYQEIDIALDTFPYNGTTTTCEALWMGVPTVTFKGDCHASRVSASIMHHAGLDEYIAEDLEGYPEKAIQLSQETGRLAALRQGIRQQLADSALCDATGFTKAMEQAFEDAYASYWNSP